MKAKNTLLRKTLNLLSDGLLILLTEAKVLVGGGHAWFAFTFLPFCYFIVFSFKRSAWKTCSPIILISHDVTEPILVSLNLKKLTSYQQSTNLQLA